MIPQTHLQNKPAENVDLPFTALPGSLARSAPTPMNDFRQVLDNRFSMLESLKGIVSMRFHDRVADKLKQEEVQAANLSGASRDKKKRQERYSHVLDPQYFEQRFL